MKTLNKIALYMVLIIGLSCWAGQAMAKKETYKASKSGTNISGAVSAIDGQFNFMITNRTTLYDYFTNRSVRNIVRLSINRNLGSVIADFTTTMTLRISGQVWNNGLQNFVSLTLPDITLRVTNVAAGGSIDQAMYVVESNNQFHLMNVEIISVTGPKESLTLEASIEIDRIYKLNPETRTFFRAVTINDNNEIVFDWLSVTGAEEYDLEWAYFDDASLGGLAGTSPDNIPIPEDYFRNKSTRITTSRNNYTAPAIYEKGYILYRVRPVGVMGNGQYIYGQWSYNRIFEFDLLGNMPYIRLDTHESNLNWQSAITYAEEGKNRAVVNYFDGAFYNRQSVTKLNSDRKVIVGETIYDHVGRPVITTLPVPANKTKIGFTPRFNRNPSGSAYNKTNFESTTAAVRIPDQMRNNHDGIGGASNYYSEQNPNRTGANALLPDAKGYPFSQTEFTPDATGRVRRQSLPGTDFKIGSDHESKYYYGKPFQAELDRLFGNDIGYAEHYNKVMRIDGNGNVSGSYVDASGKVIATFLAGPTPSNLDDVTSPGESRSVTADVLGKQSPQDNSGSANRVSQDGMSRSVNQDFLVSDPMQYTLNYELRTKKYTDICEIVANSQPICYNCVLDVKIKIVNENGQEVLLPLPGTNNNSFTVGSQSLDCNTTPTTFDATTTTLNLAQPSVAGSLEPGNYKITKTLTVNRAALDRYVQDYLVRSQQCKTFEDFLEEETAQIDLTGCDLDCESCLSQVGNYAKYSGPTCSPCLTLSEYEQLLSSCDQLCNTVGRECEVSYKAMLQDMSPGGQYGDVRSTPDAVADGQVVESENQPQTEVIDPSKFPLSVFNDNNQLPLAIAGQLATWRNPQFEADNGDVIYKYLDENGNEDFVRAMILSVNPGGSYVTNIPFNPTLFYPASGLKPGDILNVPPYVLSDVKDFIANWRASWAKSLIKYHPEYPSLVYCKELQASHDFDLKLKSTNGIAEATQNGFTAADGTAVNFLGSNSGNAVDPYFKNDLTLNPRFSQDEYNRARNKFLNYMTDPGTITGTFREMRRAAHFIVNCPEAGQTDAAGTVCNNCPTYNGVNTDAEWNMYKSLYLSMKQGFQEEKRVKQSILDKSYNGCIGDNMFNLFKYRFFFPGISNPYLDNTQPCSHFTRNLYADKVSRFQTAAQIMNSDEEQDECRLAVNNTVITNAPVDALVCSEVLQELVDAGKKDSEMKLFETCGECPAAVHLQTLMNSVAQRDGLDSDDIQLSCYPASKYPEFSLLERVLGPANPGTGTFYWDFNVSLTNNLEFVANIGRGINDPLECELKLRLLENIPQFNFANVTGLCCIDHIQNPQIYPFTPNRNFTIVANYINPATQEQKQVRLEGITSCFDIAGCTFAPTCDKNLRGKHLQTVLSALAFDYDVNPNTATDLVNETKTTNLSGDPYTNFLNAELFQNDFGNNVTWSVDIVDANTLLGTIQGSNGTQWQIELSKTTNAFAFTDIIRIGTLTITEEAEDPTRSFTLLATAKTSLGEFKVKLNGYSNLVLAGCTPVTFGEFNNGLVGHWPLNNTVQDISGNNINGVMKNNGGFSTDSREGSHSLDLNGTNQFVDLGPALRELPNPPQLPSGNSPRTISVWAMTSTIADGTSAIVAWGKPVATKSFLLLRTGADLKGGAYSDNLTIPNFWQVGVWHHLCFTYDGVTAKLYADGVEVASENKNWSLEFERAYIGRHMNNTNYWKGQIDDVRIYNRVLSADEIQNIKFLGL